MRGRIAAIVLICAAAVSPANGRAVSRATKGAHGSCRVVAGEKLLTKAGGADGLCAAVEHAVVKVAPKARYKAEVKVLPRSRISTTLVVDGRAQPEQKFAVMDDELRPDTIERFAEGLAAQVAEASKR